MNASRVFLLTVMGVGAGGWFMLSWKVMGNSPDQAVNEAIGAALGLLLLISIIGALRRGRGNVGN